MRRPLLLMRKKGLLGSYFGQHAGINCLSKSVGQAVSSGIIDTVAPTVPAGLAVGTPTASSLTATWSASTDNVAVTGYKVFRDASEVSDQAGLTFVDSGLSPSTQYTYTVLAYDAAGNESAQSLGVNGTTTA